MVRYSEDQDFLTYLGQIEEEYGLPQGMLPSIAAIESNFNPTATSPVGAQGMFQFMPETWKQYGQGGDVFNPYDAAKASAQYLQNSIIDFGGDMDQTVASYNAGPGAVKKYGGVPPYKETQKYVTRFNDKFGQWGMRPQAMLQDSFQAPRQGPDGIYGNLGNQDALIPQQFSGGASSGYRAPAGGYTPSQTINRNPAATSAAAGAEPQKKKSGLSGLLPLLFQFGLPIATGAALGANSGGAFNALSGALMGATSGGMSYLGAQAQDKKNKNLLQQKQITAAPQYERNQIAKNKNANDFYINALNAKTNNDYKMGRLTEEQYRTKLQEIDLLRKNAESSAEQGTRDFRAQTDRFKAESDIEKKLKDKEPKDPAEGIMVAFSNQFGGQPLDPNNQEQVNQAAQLLTVLRKKETDAGTGVIFDGDDRKLTLDMINAYNQRLVNGGVAAPVAPAAPTGGTPVTETPQQKALRELQRRKSGK